MNVNDSNIIRSTAEVSDGAIMRMVVDPMLLKYGNSDGEHYSTCQMFLQDPSRRLNHGVVWRKEGRFGCRSW